MRAAAPALIYALIICLPLLLHPYRRLRLLGVALAVSFVVSQLAFQHVFTSVWCYLGVLMSVLLLWIICDASALTAWP